MATLAPGTRVDMAPDWRAMLVFPPPTGSDLSIAVHSGALRAGASSLLTEVVALVARDIVWAGAVDERMVATLPGSQPHISEGSLGEADRWVVSGTLSGPDN